MEKEQEEKSAGTEPQYIVKWCVISFSIACLLGFIAYAAGNVLGASDKTHLLILNLSSYLCILVSVGAFFGMIFNVFLFFYHEHSRKFIFSALLYLIPVILGIIAALFVLFIISALEGNIS